MSGSRAPSVPEIRRAAVITHGRPEKIGAGLERIEHVARECGVELVLPEDEQAKHGRDDGRGTLEQADLAVVLGGDGTMLRALNRFLGTGVPVLGVNFGRVGFLSSIRPDELESSLARAFGGELKIVELATLRAEVAGETRCGVNDVVARSADIGRMVELGWAVGDENLGSQPCDGLICSTPAGSTAYNLSNGGPVLMWGLDAMAITFVAPHSLSARPLVVPRGRGLAVRNLTPDVAMTILVDGHVFAEVGPEGSVAIDLDDKPALLATLPETTFFRRYRDTFAS